MGLGNWLKKKAAMLSLAMAKVEETTLTQGGTAVESSVGSYQRVNQGRLSDSLQRGEITQEVKELRWRMYKIIKATDGVTATITGYDEDGMPIVEVTGKSKRRYMKNVQADVEDPYKPIMVVNNAEVTLGTFGGTDVEALEEVEGEATEDEDGDTTRSIGEVSFDEYISNVKSERPIKVTRNIRPKFEIEDYTKKMIVREIEGDERLLEFYVSIYPDEYNRKSRFFLSELQKAMKNPRASDSLDIEGVNYITQNTMGASDYELYEYVITGVHKIVEFDGHYVIKFKANVTINGDNIIDKFRELDLDERYKNKEAK